MSEVENPTLQEEMRALARGSRAASHSLCRTSAVTRNAALLDLADRIVRESDRIVAANSEDLKTAAENEVSGAMLDRLTLSPERIRTMADGVRQIASLPDPVGEEIERLHPENGLDIRKIRVPIGVIGIIYESRPNVTVDCAALCLKSANACILRGGKEAFFTNTALAEIVQESLSASQLDPQCVQLVPTTDRTALKYLLRLNEDIHCLIPRGGEGLIRYVSENSTIPVIKHYKGVCNLYWDKDADRQKATAITLNAKCQRPGVCNAIENLILHKDIAEKELPGIARSLIAAGVSLRADDAAYRILQANELEAEKATEEDWGTEYLDLILSIRVVDSTEEAIRFIHQYGSQHSDAILTENETTALSFLNAVDTATAYWNASTRFTDGFEFGLGAEVGISTDRIHARGPMGIRELCTYKYQIFGKGEIRT